MDKQKLNSYSESINAFPDEVAQLENVNKKLNADLQSAVKAVDKLDEQYNDTKRYMAKNRGELDPGEMFQNELALKQIDSSGAFAVETKERLEKLCQSPYFARIDFKAGDDNYEKSYYIGRFTFLHEGEFVIFDWRAPVAGMFYDYEIGKAGYTAPSGDIEGILTRKRQFKIESGELKYILETSLNVGDDVLQRELANTSDEKMKSIIATIQREQNSIIRGEESKTIIIQGAAGSGKTSIALHRVAFLLYCFKNKLTAQNITIISPNKVFASYISSVLPELGEEPIFSVSLAEIAAIQLDGIIGFEPDVCGEQNSDDDFENRVRFKSTVQFLKAIEEYADQMPNIVFKAQDYAYELLFIPKIWIEMRFNAYSKLPVKVRLAKLADDIHERLIGENTFLQELPKPRAILKWLKPMLSMKSTLAVYKDFYRHIEMPHMLKMPNKKTLEAGDVYPFLYLHSLFEGLHEGGIIKHLVIDEMQDYTPTQFAVVNKLFACQKTILGDFSQQINENLNHTLQDIKNLYPGAAFVQLNTSYRSTYEIINFAKTVQPTAQVQPIRRHGEQPQVIGFEREEEEFEWLNAAIKNMAQSGCKSLGIIAKTNYDAQVLYGRLHTESDVNIITPESRNFTGGVCVTSATMAKGLEFDWVIVANADERNYHTQYHRTLLYVACTRAMHKLTLLYCGNPSKFIV